MKLFILVVGAFILLQVIMYIVIKKFNHLKDIG